VKMLNEKLPKQMHFGPMKEEPNRIV